MLLRFGVANYLSIKEPQALSLAASSLRDVEDGLIECAAAPERRVLPAAMIYGANASGKSNVVAALRFIRWSILFSHSRGEPGGRVPRKPFALDPGCAEEPSTFETDFVIDGTRYHYGFSALDEAFCKEWLYVFPKNRRQMLFERDSKNFNFGRGLKGHNKVIADLTRSNSLFLSAAVQNGHEQLSKIADFFDSMKVEANISIPGGVASLRLAKNEVDRRVLNFLSTIDTGIVDYRKLQNEMPDSIKTMMQDFKGFAKKHLDVDFELNNLKIQLAHRGSGDEPIFLDLDVESAGTCRLLIMLGPIFLALDAGALFVIDELDASLHTRACEAVLALFSSRRTNPKGAQLIATTHDTNLLRSPILRRDQVWFTEKDARGATHLYPLTDIRTRRDDNIEKGYLQGRFGAIPFSGNIVDLVSTV